MRADGIGDALACAPLVATLRAAGHVVGAVLGTANRAVYARRTFCAVHVLERIPWPRHGSTPTSRRVALDEVRAARYDVALVASEELEAYEFARDARIARRIGYANGWEKPLKTIRLRALATRLLLRPASAARVREHEAETLFRLGAGLGFEDAPTRDVARLQPLVLDLPPRPHGKIVLQVSHKLAAAGLGLGAYAAVARELLRRGYGVVATGDDGAAVASVARAGGVEGRAPLGLGAWKALIGGARALVAPDSGAAHVAGMLGIPCVDCFAPCPTTARDIVRWHPWASAYRAHVLDPLRERAETGRAIAGEVEGVLA